MSRWPKSVVKMARKVAGKRKPRPDGQNENEARFNRMILGGIGKYEPSHFYITRVNKRVYTPDFAITLHNVTKQTRTDVFAEVKGSYKLQSEDRARLAWEVAAENTIPEHVFAWARWTPRGRFYECEAWARRGERRATANCRTKDDFIALLKEVVE
jgi:hypothetical protein